LTVFLSLLVRARLVFLDPGLAFFLPMAVPLAEVTKLSILELIIVHFSFHCVSSLSLLLFEERLVTWNFYAAV
jgi:hypothetical protein